MEPLLNDLVDLLRSRRTTSGWTIPRLASALSISRPRVLRTLDEIQGLGYQIKSDNHSGIHLIAVPDRMIDTEILAGLKTRTFGCQLHCYRRIGSTNSRACQLADTSAPEGTIVVAEEQTAGKGRLNRSWHSPPYLGIWSSVILRPKLSLPRVSGLSLLAALAFAETAERELGLTVDLKWPNDGLIQGKKVLGVLTEVSAEGDRLSYAVCGTGINVSHEAVDFPAELRKRATSLKLAMGQSIDRLAFFRAFLGEFEHAYRSFRGEGITPFLPEYRRRSILLGREVVVQQGAHTVMGTGVGIDENGALVIREGRRDVVVFAGEVTLREPSARNSGE